VPAVLGMGSTPGTMNVLARYGVDLLDTVERADALCAWVDEASVEGPFIPPYALRTMQEEPTSAHLLASSGVRVTSPIRALFFRLSFGLA
jgi:hypothetical protein